MTKANHNPNSESKNDRRISNRTVQIGTRVTPQFKRLIERICYEEQINLVELIEWAITELEQNRVKGQTSKPSKQK